MIIKIASFLYFLDNNTDGLGYGLSDGWQKKIRWIFVSKKCHCDQQVFIAFLFKVAVYCNVRMFFAAWRVLRETLQKIKIVGKMLLISYCIASFQKLGEINYVDWLTQWERSQWARRVRLLPCFWRIFISYCFSKFENFSWSRIFSNNSIELYVWLDLGSILSKTFFVCYFHSCIQFL